MAHWQDIYDKHRARLFIVCDQPHIHSVQSGCFNGPKASVEICTMAEEIMRLRNDLKQIKGIINKHWERR